MKAVIFVATVAALSLALWLGMIFYASGHAVFNVQHYGAAGDGITNDAPAIKATLDALAANRETKKTLYFPRGVYRVVSDHAPSTWGANPSPTTFPFSGKTSAFALGDGQIEIKGEGKAVSVIITDTPRTLFDAYLGARNGLQLDVKKLTFKYTGGWNQSSNCTAFLLASEHTRAVRIADCAFYDFTTAIYAGGASSRLEILRSDFLYTHGRASIAQLDPSFQFPSVAILESAGKTVIEGCYFDGLVDPAFTGVSSSVDPSQKCALDGFFATNHSGSDVIVRANTIKNNNIEGIHLLKASAKTTTLIEDNSVIGALVHSDFYYGIRGGVVSDRPAIVRRNTISQQGGRAYGGVVLNLTKGADTFNQSRVENNTIFDCWNGIVLSGASAGTIVQNNVVRGWSNYPPGEIEAGFGAARIGIHLINCSDVLVKGNSVDGGAKDGWWYRSSTVSTPTEGMTNTATRVYVSDPTVFTAGAQINLRKTIRDGQSDRFATIAAIGSNYIELDAAWAHASQLATSAVPGDQIVSFKPGMPLDPTRIGAIHAFNSTGTRVTGNVIRNFTRAFNPSGLSSSDNFVEGKSVDDAPRCRSSPIKDRIVERSNCWS